MDSFGDTLKSQDMFNRIPGIENLSQNVGFSKETASG